MTLNTHEILYIQALGAYPYELAECIEKLQYVLNATNEHPGAHYLLGKIYEEQLRDYKKARYHYEMALYIDHKFAPVYFQYADLLISLDEMEEALKVINIGLEIPGTDKASLLYLNGILYEHFEMYHLANEYYKKAKLSALNNDFTHFMDEQLNRVKEKLNQIKKGSAFKNNR